MNKHVKALRNNRFLFSDLTWDTSSPQSAFNSGDMQLSAYSTLQLDAQTRACKFKVHINSSARDEGRKFLQ